jgi:hypothetical protein
MPPTPTVSRGADAGKPAGTGVAFRAMNIDPWTSDDPQPGDFDEVLASIDARHLERYDGDPSPSLRILVSVQGEDALRLERIAGQLGKTPHDVVADLLCDADRPAA